MDCLFLKNIEFDNINPILSNNKNVQDISRLIFEPLFTLTQDYKIEGVLAKECSKIDENAKKLFDSAEVCSMPEELLRKYLVEYKVALQPNKQPLIWKKLCETIENKLDGDIRNLFEVNGYSVKKINDYINENKKDFPYLGGNKICNYWLYVMEQYTDVQFVDRENLTVAPDTHVVQASQRLGVISEEEMHLANVQQIVAERWAELLKGTELTPIDVHTPMWLWSRGRFERKL